MSFVQIKKRVCHPEVYKFLKDLKIEQVLVFPRQGEHQNLGVRAEGETGLPRRGVPSEVSHPLTDPVFVPTVTNTTSGQVQSSIDTHSLTQSWVIIWGFS